MSGDRGGPLVHQTIDCIDCGGTCHLLTKPDDTLRFWAGDLLTYRCADCGDRWDLLVPDEPDLSDGSDW